MPWRPELEEAASLGIAAAVVLICSVAACVVLQS